MVKSLLHKKRVIKKEVVIIWLTSLFTAIAMLFWYNDWKYNLPTPVPENYKAVNTGKNIGLTQPSIQGKKKPLFLHFFNPTCPCSRFNMAHFKMLVKQYSQEVDFEIVVMSTKKYTEEEIQDKFDTQVPVSFDQAIADSCGVYSTPQAVIIDTNQKLYYRGNYNRSRYCSDKKTEYARMALDTLLHHGTAVIFDQFALKAYGCQLPKCTK